MCQLPAPINPGWGLKKALHTYNALCVSFFPMVQEVQQMAAAKRYLEQHHSKQVVLLLGEGQTRHFTDSSARLSQAAEMAEHR